MLLSVARCKEEYEEEYSVKHNIYREFLEELVGRDDLERPKGQIYHKFFYNDPNLRYLDWLERKGHAKFYFTGIAINLLNLRPEICTLLLITDPEWIVNQGQGRAIEVEGSHLQLDILRTCWEFKQGNEPETVQRSNGLLNLGPNLEIPHTLFRPENFVASGAAALELGVAVAREELGRK